MNKNIINDIMKIKDVLPKKQKLLCDYIILNHAKIGIMTAAELADVSGVGTTTVMRLTKLLNYTNYGDFKHDILEYSLANVSSYGTFKQEFKNIANTEQKDPLTTTCSKVIRSIENFITPQNIKAIDRAVELMIKSPSISILGLRSSKAVASYFEFMIDRIYPKVKELSSQSEFLYDKALRLKSDELVIIFSIWPCTKKTIDIANICHEKNIPIVLITNTTLNPIAKFAEVVIDTNSVNSSVGNLPAMFVAETLYAELGRKLPEEATENLEELERNLDRYGLFMWDAKL